VSVVCGLLSVVNGHGKLEAFIILDDMRKILQQIFILNDYSFRKKIIVAEL
jgi:hypothetical protein